MPLFGLRQNSNKAKIEQQLDLARENTDTLIDLSYCNLKSIPAEVYELCYKLKKKYLYLPENRLKSLLGEGSLRNLSYLQILDIRNNKLKYLTCDIRHLTNLKQLHLDGNKLRDLPKCICEITHLQLLSCRHNKLQTLPVTLGTIQSLETIYLQGNALWELPNTLCLAKNIKILDLGNNYSGNHPPLAVVRQGTLSIMKYLAESMGTEYNKNPDKRDDSTDETKRTKKEMKGANVNPEEEKMELRLKTEREILERQEREFKMYDSKKTGRDKLMEDLVKQQTKITEEFEKFQKEKDFDRAKLVKEIQQIENEADNVISKMLSLNNNIHDPARILRQEELDRVEYEKIFSKHSDELRKKEILNAMESILKDEILQRDKFREYEKRKAEIVSNSLWREVEWDGIVTELIVRQKNKNMETATSINTDENFQAMAVATLLEKRDLESVRLRTQLKIIEGQLAALTRIELAKSQNASIQLQFDVSEKRLALSNLLVQVLNEQQERKKHLFETFSKMEECRQEESSVYWLQQYQKLLDSMPSIGFTPVGLDPALVSELASYGVIHLLPFLVNLGDLSLVTDKHLKKIGITKEDDRAGILKVISSYTTNLEMNKECKNRIDIQIPSAPLEISEPSAPELNEECIICMESECEIVFVPCGHLCTCTKCNESLILCPLCRGNIERKVQVIRV